MLPSPTFKPIRVYMKLFRSWWTFDTRNFASSFIEVNSKNRCMLPETAFNIIVIFGFHLSYLHIGCQRNRLTGTTTHISALSISAIKGAWCQRVAECEWVLTLLSWCMTECNLRYQRIELQCELFLKCSPDILSSKPWNHYGPHAWPWLEISNDIPLSHTMLCVKHKLHCDVEVPSPVTLTMWLLSHTLSIVGGGMKRQ